MKFRYDLVMLDLDGTLTDSGTGIMNGVKEGFRAIGWPVPPADILRKFIGPPACNLLSQMYPQMSEETIQEFIQGYRKYYKKQGAFENEVYPGIFDLLAQLREGGVKLAVATSKPITPTKIVLEHFELTPRFDYISAENDTDSGGGKEYLIFPVLEHFGIPASRAVMVGDTRFDAAGARNANTNFVGVLYGFGSQEEMEHEGAKHFVHSAPELLDFLIDKS